MDEIIKLLESIRTFLRDICFCLGVLLGIEIGKLILKMIFGGG